MPSHHPETFGRYARRCRKLARTSLYDLGKATGLAPAQLQEIERDQAPPPFGLQLDHWAAALGVDPAVFRERALPAIPDGR